MDSVETTNCNSTEFKDEFEDQYLAIDQREEYEHYQKELKRISYSDIIDHNARVATMVVSENQSLFNAISVNKPPETDEIIRNVIPNLLVSKVAHVSPMLGPIGQVFVENKSKNIIGHKVYSKTRMLATRITKDMSIDDISKSLIKEIDGETIKDLHNEIVSPTRTSCFKDANEQELTDALKKIRSQLSNEAVMTTFFIVNRNVCDKYKEFFDKCRHNLRFCIKVVDSPYDDMIVASKSYTPRTGSYFFCPYVLLMHAEKDRYFTRYDKKYVPPEEGEKGSFGLITFDKDREAIYNI